MPKRNSIDNANESVLRLFAQFEPPSDLVDLGKEALRAIGVELRKARVGADQIEDVFQSALLATFEALQKKPARVTNVRAYFLSACRSEARRWLKDISLQEQETRLAQEWLAALRGEVSLPKEPLEDEQSMVLAALSRLSERPRKIIKLTMIDNLPPEEISASLGLSPAAFRTAKARAFRTLRDVLKSDLADLIRSRMAKPATSEENELWREFKADIENEG